MQLRPTQELQFNVLPLFHSSQSLNSIIVPRILIAGIIILLIENKLSRTSEEEIKSRLFEVTNARSKVRESRVGSYFVKARLVFSTCFILSVCKREKRPWDLIWLPLDVMPLTLTWLNEGWYSVMFRASNKMSSSAPSLVTWLSFKEEQPNLTLIIRRPILSRFCLRTCAWTTFTWKANQINKVPLNQKAYSRINSTERYVHQNMDS